MKETTIRKLTSRKFWSAVIGFVTPLMLAFGYTDSNSAAKTSETNAKTSETDAESAKTAMSSTPDGFDPY